MEIVYVVVPVLFFCIANWSLTTLMDGEGKFVEIFISTCYALVAADHHQSALDLAEQLYLDGGDSLLLCLEQHRSPCGFLYLLFIGNMTVQQFTAAKRC